MRSLPLLLALTSFALVGLFYLLKPVVPAPADSQLAPVDETLPRAVEDSVGQAAPQAPPIEDVFTVKYELREGSLVAGPKRVSVVQGAAIRIVAVSDAADELHLHGYDLTLDLQPDVPAELRFVAEHSGRFELELHHNHLTLGAIEVQPR